MSTSQAEHLSTQRHPPKVSRNNLEQHIPAPTNRQGPIAPMASTLATWIPPAEGLLPKWLLFVRRPQKHSLIRNPTLAQNTQITRDPTNPNTPGISRLNPKLHPILQHPNLHLARVQPHLHRPARQATRARNLALEPYVRHLDVPDVCDSLLRCVQYQ